MASTPTQLAPRDMTTSSNLSTSQCIPVNQWGPSPAEVRALMKSIQYLQVSAAKFYNLQRLVRSGVEQVILRLLNNDHESDSSQAGTLPVYFQKAID